MAKKVGWRVKADAFFSMVVGLDAAPGKLVVGNRADNVRRLHPCLADQAGRKSTGWDIRGGL
jgi:hypothetical protein